MCTHTHARNTDDYLELKEDRTDGESWPSRNHIFDVKKCTFLHGTFASFKQLRTCLIHRLAACSSWYKALDGSYIKKNSYLEKALVFNTMQLKKKTTNQTQNDELKHCDHPSFYVRKPEFLLSTDHR